MNTVRENTDAFYRDRIASTGSIGPKSIGWGSARSQEARFSVFPRSIESGILLDVGCGYGALYDWLGSQYSGTYIGIDRNPDVIAAARAYHPEREYAFCCVDIVDCPTGSFRVDWAVASGLFAVDGCDAIVNAQAIIVKMYAMATVGIAYNMLSTETPYERREGAAYFDPVAIRAEMRKAFGGRIDLISGYLANDFTVVVYK